jgi:asparagine synthase (glutamine-hydrolysing)
MVCQKASQSVKVTLCGDGGDELLAGYPFFRLSMRERWGGSTLKRQHHWARAIGSLREGRSQEKAWAKLARNLSAAISPLQRSLVYEHYCREPERPTLYQLDFLRQVQSSRREYQASLLDETDADTYPLNQLLAIHYAGYFANDLLVKTDIASMAYGLEMRAPLLDHELMAFAATLNPNLKYRKGVGKYLLKRVAGKYIPADLIHRPKQGFSVPVAEWMRSHFSAQIRDMVATPGHPLWRYLQSQTVSRWLAQHQAHQVNHGKRLWLILLLGLWLDRA